MTRRWELFAHDADMGVRGFGATVAEAFEHAALAMTSIVTDVELVDAQEEISIECEAPDLELLFADWLNAVISEMSARHMLFRAFKVRLDGSRLHGQAWGERVDAARHRPAVEIKGATYTALRVAFEGNAWMAQTVVDV